MGRARRHSNASQEGGITFLNQLHLIFVDAWFFFAGIGWTFLGLAALSGRNWVHNIGYGMLTAGIMLTAGVISTYWLPTYGEMAPSFIGSLANKLGEGGMALGLLTSGLLGWTLWAFPTPAHGTVE